MGEFGKRIVGEGTDGTGKSTVIKRLRTELVAAGHIVAPIVEEPEDHTLPITSAIRSIIKNGDLSRRPETNLGLFSSSRAEIFLENTLPALKRGEWSVAARDVSSTIVYQAYAEGLDPRRVFDMTRAILGDEAAYIYLNPDSRVIFLINDEEERNRRINDRGPLENPDTFEMRGEDFQQKLLGGYALLAQEYGIPVIDAGGTKDEVYARFLAQVRKDIPTLPL